MKHHHRDSSPLQSARRVLLVASFVLPWAVGCQINFDDLNADGDVNTGDIGNNRGDEDDDRPAGSEGGPCYGNGTCNEGLVCVAQVCVDQVGGDAGPDDERDGGEGLSDDPCTSDSSCSFGEYCNTANGRCSLGCRSDLSCGESEICNADHQCEAVDEGGGADGGVDDGADPGCTSHAVCAPNEYCDFSAGICRVGCRSDLSCNAGQTCNPAHVCDGVSVGPTEELDLYVPNGPEVRVNSFHDGKQQLPTVAGLTGGGFVVTWMSFQEPGNDFDIYFQMYDADGTPVGTERRANTTTVGAQLQPLVVALPSGGFIICWASSGEFGQGSWGLRVQRFRADGSAVGSVIRPTENMPYPILHEFYGGPYAFSMAALPSGGFLVGWLEDAAVDGRDVMMAQRFNEDGTAREEPLMVSEPVPYADVGAIAIAVLADDAYVAVWNEHSLIGLPTVLAGRSVGQVLGDVVQLELAGENGQPALAVGPADTIYAVWQGGDGDNWGVNGTMLDSNLQPLTSQAVINTYTYINQLCPAVTTLPNEGFVATWFSNAPGGPGVHHVRARRFDSEGSPIGNDVVISADPYEPSPRRVWYPHVATMNDGSIVFAWHALDADSPFFQYMVSPDDVMMRHYVKVTELKPGMLANRTENGDFRDGGGFSSELASLASISAGNSGYAIAENVTNASGASCELVAHQGVSDRMFIADTTGAAPGTTVWAQTVSVDPNEQHVVAGWVASWVPSGSEGLDLYVGGTRLETIVIPSTCGTWMRFEARWTADANEEAEVAIKTVTEVGESIALDDIVVSSLVGAF